MFQEYLKRYRYEITEGDANNGICFDGVVDSEKYFARANRLMFLLKETNSNKMNGERQEIITDWNYMDWVQKQANQEEPLYRSIFRNIAMWSKMFDSYATGTEPNEIEYLDNNGLIADEALHEALKHIAIVNLKKSWGNEQTDWNAMKEYLNNDVRKEILLFQMRELSPTMILCGGTFDFAHMVFGENCSIQKIKCGSGRNVEFFEKEGKTFVNCYHPSRPGWSRKASFEYMNNIFKVVLENGFWF